MYRKLMTKYFLAALYGEQKKRARSVWGMLWCLFSNKSDVHPTDSQETTVAGRRQE